MVLLLECLLSGCIQLQTMSICKYVLFLFHTLEQATVEWIKVYFQCVYSKTSTGLHGITHGVCLGHGASRETLNKILPLSSMLSFIFISWSILKPSAWFSVLGCCCIESACSHRPFTAVGSTTTAGSGTVVESGGVGSVIFSVGGRGSIEALHKCLTWVRSAGLQTDRDPETDKEGDFSQGAEPVAPSYMQSGEIVPEIRSCTFQNKSLFWTVLEKKIFFLV